MAKYLLNTTMSTYLFKGGSLEIEPAKSKAVTDIDFNSGIFEAAILSGALQCFNSPEEIPLITGTIPEPVKTETLAKGIEPGATNDELISFMATQKAKAEAGFNKYRVENTDSGVIEITALEESKPKSEVTEVAEVKIEPEAKNKKLSRKATATQGSTDPEAS